MPKATVAPSEPTQNPLFASPIQIEMQYRLTDFAPLFLRRQLRRTATWLGAAALVTLSTAIAVYAVSMALAGRGDELSLWLLLVPVLLLVFMTSLLFGTFANARILHRFYQQQGARVVARLDAGGMRLGTGRSAMELPWQEATRFDVRRRALVVWKGEALPLVLPTRCMDAGIYDHILQLVSRSLAALRAEQVAHEEQERPTAEQTVTPTAPMEAAAAQATPLIAPDYSESEYRFGDEWVPGGIRFRIHIGPRDRAALKEYALSRPGSRYGFIILVLIATGMAGWLFVTASQQDAMARTTTYLFAVFSTLIALLFLTALVRPALFLRLAQRLPGNRQRQDSARRDVLCVFSSGVLYAKTEGRVDRVAIGDLHDIVHFKNWLFLFRDRKTAYLIPLDPLDPLIRTQIGQELGIDLYP